MLVMLFVVMLFVVMLFLVMLFVVIVLVVVMLGVVMVICISLADTSHTNREGKHQGQHQLCQIGASQLADAF